MKFRVSKKIFDKFPDAKFGGILITSIDNSDYSEELNKVLKNILNEVSNKLENKYISKIRSVISWRWIFDQIETIKNESPSHEALLKRLKTKKILPKINPIVDIYNAISVKHSIPLGGHSLENFSEVILGETNGDEKFLPMNSTDPQLISKGEFAYLYEKNILTRHFVWRQSEMSKVGNDTKEIFIPIDDAPGIESKEKIQKIAEELIYLVQKFLGGKAKFAIVDKYNSVIDFDNLEEYSISDIRNIEIEFNYNFSINTDEKEIDEILNRGISEILPQKEEFKKLLMSGKRITFYQGYDPSAASLHIGNAIGMRMLEKLRKLGHKIIFLIGTGTGKIGDPTDKDATRKVLTDDVIQSNIAGWIDQASQVLNFNDPNNPVQIVRNGDWLKPMSLDKFLTIGNHITVQQLLERDMFQKRLKEGKPISLSEMIYPILQGYDSVAMEVDGEFGGNDQLFNMMMGRTLEKVLIEKEKFVITGKILADANGVKMGKSLGNVINLTDEPKDIYGKVMSFSDGMIANGFEILTDTPMEKVEEIRTKILDNNINPMEYKKELAFEVTKWIKGEDNAKKAQEFFEKTIQNQEVPQDITTIDNKDLKSLNIIDILENLELVSSRGDAKRLVLQGGIEINSKKINDIKYTINLNNLPQIIKAGKRSWIKIV